MLKFRRSATIKLNMPIIRSAKKALRQSQKRQAKNRSEKIGLKKTIKTLTKTIEAGEAAKAKELLPVVYKKIDKAAKRGIFKKNTAGRKKSRLATAVNKLTTSSSPSQ